jgi:steroid delta-isomerase-like uncharacterized protein
LKRVREATLGGRILVETNKTILRRYYEEALNQGNLSVIEELFTPELVETFKQAVTMSRTAFPDLQVTIEDQIAEGDRVVTRWTVRGTHNGPFAGMPATGKPVTVTAIHIHRIHEGKIAELWEQINLLGLLQQLGVVPPVG